MKSALMGSRNRQREFELIKNERVKRSPSLDNQGRTIAHNVLGLRSNSLPRSGRTLPQQPKLIRGLSTVASSLINQEDDDGALSAPELPAIRRDRGKNMNALYSRIAT